MRNIQLSNLAYKRLNEHLESVKKEKDQVLDRLFPCLSNERSEFEKYMSSYVDQISALLSSAHREETDDHQLPFVVVNSEVSLWDLNRNKSVNLKITGPCVDNRQRGSISCISPVGRSILLRSINDEVTVEVPAGLVQYRIQSISL